MNASASALPREVEVQSKIRKVRAFGRNARVACGALFKLGLVGSVLVLMIFLLLIFAPTDGLQSKPSDGGLHDVMIAPFTPVLFKVWVSLLLSGVIGVWLAAVYQLYRLFGNLAAGAIHTSENVRRVWNVGLLLLLWPILKVVIPSAIIAAHRLFGTSVPLNLNFPSFSELLNSSIAAGLVLLVSWILDVGLYEKEHADALRRDADLTI